MNDTANPVPFAEKTFAHCIGPLFLGLRSFLQHPVRPVLFLVIVGLILRVALILGADGLMWADSNTYYHGALRILQKGIFTHQSIYRTPMFPIYLSLFLRLGETPLMGTLAIVGQHLLGLAAVLIFYAAFRRIFGPSVAFLGALLLNMHSVFLYYEKVVQTELLFMFFLSVVTWCLVRALEHDRLWRWALLGAALAFLTLTRPTGQLLLPALFPVIWWNVRSFRRAFLAFSVAASVLVGIMTPWMMTNLRHYGFFGVVHIQGTQLYHKAFDKAKLPPPPRTSHGEADELTRELLSVERSPRARIDWTAFATIQDRYGFTPLRADQELFGYAVETVMASFPTFALDTARDFLFFYWKAKPSPTFKNNEEGPYLASKHGRRFAMPAFPCSKVTRFPVIREAIVLYFRYVALPMKPLVILWLAGAVLFFVFSKKELKPAALACFIIPVYLGAFTVPFDTYQDRYRLHADPYIFVFAMFSLVWAYRRLMRQEPAATPPVSPPNAP